MVRVEFLLLILILNSNEHNINETNKAKIFFKKKGETSKKNLLIGSVINYNWTIIEPFFKSLKQANFKNCDFIIFVGNMTKKTIDKIQSCGVLIHEIPLHIFKNMKIINYRWKLYADFLQNNKDKYNLVFTADIRDTIFQQDLFYFLPNNSSFLGIALEDCTLSEETNKKWIINAYGEDVHKKIESQRTICIGTLWGTVDIFLNFSIIMYEKLSSQLYINNKVIEQAVTNYLIYYEKLFNDYLIKSDNKDGKVMTIGVTKRENILLDIENNILNLKGEKAAVIHQYDRKPNIRNLIINKYCPEIKNLTKNESHNFLIINKTSLTIISTKYKNNYGLVDLMKRIIEIREFFILIIFLIY